MIRAHSLRSSRRSHPAQRFSLLALLVATSVAGIAACSSDDDDSSTAETETLPLEDVDPVEVPERDLPAAAPAAPAAPIEVVDTPNGLSLPADMEDWRVIGVVNVPGDPAGTVRVVLGNDTAVDAARAGQTDPWPDGSMLGHIQWAATSSMMPGSTATVPGDFAAVTLMVKDSVDYVADGGWAYGVWRGDALTPPDAGFDRACVDCHTERVSDQDFVFTVPGALPAQAAIDAAPAMPNGVELPDDILDWRVISIASRETDMTPTIRVVIGNDIAVDAARSGQTNPWPDGSMLAHYNWGAGEAPAIPGTTSAVSFAAFTLMVKDSAEYAADGGWAYGAWPTLDLGGQMDPEFDRACVDCHTANVPDNDYVFTVPGALPAALLAP